MKKLLLFIIPVLLIFAGCSRPNISIRNQTLSRHVWQMTAYTENGVDALKDCQKDDQYYFYGSGNGTMFEGPNSCDSEVIVTGSDQSKDTTVPVTEIDFTWSVTGDQRYIYIKQFGNPDYNPEWQILDMSEQSFHVKGIDHRNGEIITYYKTFASVKSL